MMGKVWCGYSDDGCWEMDGCIFFVQRILTHKASTFVCKFIYDNMHYVIFGWGGKNAKAHTKAIVFFLLLWIYCGRMHRNTYSDFELPVGLGLGLGWFCIRRRCDSMAEYITFTYNATDTSLLDSDDTSGG